LRVSKTKLQEEGKVHQDDDWKIIHQPKTFVETFKKFKDLYLEHNTIDGNESVENFFREIRRDIALEMLNAAVDAHNKENSDYAWYFLVQAAEAIGYLIASKGAVYPSEDEAEVSFSHSKSGSKGGKTKGENAKKIEDEIAEKLCSAKPPKKGWDKAALRREYNKVIEDFETYNDSDRKWRALFKREDIQNLLPQDEH
jgi:hypothetical protein